MKTYKTLKTRPRRANEDEDETQDASKGLGYFSQSRQCNLFRFFLDEGIGDPSKYRTLIQTLLSANEGDEIEIWINSPGGQLATTEAIINAIEMSQATVTGIICTQAYSAAGMIALRCPNLMVTRGASMMIHEASYGAGADKGSEVKAYTDFSEKMIHAVIDRVYEGFLTEKEINDLKHGKTFWMQEGEILDRLGKREKYLEKQAQAVLDGTPEKPKKARKGKKASIADIADEIPSVIVFPIDDSVKT